MKNKQKTKKRNPKPESRNRIRESGLTRECAKLDPKYEQYFAELGFSADVASWPEY